MKLEELLLNGCNDIDVNIDKKQIENFLRYKDLLIEWNEKVNLTTILEENEIIIKHFVDSLTILKYIDLSNKKVIDVGTGAGFPGFPLKIIDSSIKLTLLDSLNKRILFLQEVKKQLNIENINIVHGRAEDFAINKEYREKYDHVVSRAVANLSTLCEYCLPFVSVGGSFISLKGPEVEQETNEAKNAINILGGSIEKIEKIKLPFTDIIHSLVFIKKIKQTPTKYPRKAGKPSKEPIK